MTVSGRVCAVAAWDLIVGSTRRCPVVPVPLQRRQHGVRFPVLLPVRHEADSLPVAWTRSSTGE